MDKLFNKVNLGLQNTELVNNTKHFFWNLFFLKWATLEEVRDVIESVVQKTNNPIFVSRQWSGQLLLNKKQLLFWKNESYFFFEKLLSPKKGKKYFSEIQKFRKKKNDFLPFKKQLFFNVDTQKKTICKYSLNCPFSKIRFFVFTGRIQYLPHCNIEIEIICKIFMFLGENVFCKNSNSDSVFFFLRLNHCTKFWRCF